MKVRDIMSSNLYICSPETSLVDLAGRMRDMDVGVIPVCEGPELKGIITDRDLAIRAVMCGMDPATTPAEQIMTRQVVKCYEDQDVAEAAGIMRERRIRRLAVLDRSEELVGMVSLSDIAGRGNDIKSTGRALKAISRPSRS